MKAQCTHGHDLGDAYLVRDGRRYRRRCRPCQKRANRHWYAANRERIAADRRTQRAASCKAAAAEQHRHGRNPRHLCIDTRMAAEAI